MAEALEQRVGGVRSSLRRRRAAARVPSSPELVDQVVNERRRKRAQRHAACQHGRRPKVRRGSGSGNQRAHIGMCGRLMGVGCNDRGAAERGHVPAGKDLG